MSHPIAPNRREFLNSAAASVGVFGLIGGMPSLAVHRPSARRCIFLFLTGGPSQLDTFDPKPNAPEEVRGPFRPIATTVPGIQLAETLPRLAATAHRFALVRSLYHEEAPIHETGQQLVQTGRLCRAAAPPHLGALATYLAANQAHRESSAWALLPGSLGDTGVGISHGQSEGWLGEQHAPLTLRDDAPPFVPAVSPRTILLNGLWEAFDLERERPALRARYGATRFGQHVLLARRLVERGLGLVAVNMFATVFNELSWDCHADGGALAASLDDYRSVVCPTFDAACSALLDDLAERGLLESTLVVAVGEFGRTPRLNPRGGRDHWPGVWSMLIAGGGVRGGRVVGASDAIASEPRDQPIHAARVASTVLHALGVDSRTTIPDADGNSIPVLEGEPIAELFC